ncbi:metal-response element-binding transcription factor 2-like protein [Dinothrombium tinctorium]|uniref:Metal-response element-binding transcription factor 2-like protein n=1 Tax=Dinothrombium tinctorium TaxID=1965070 RepID=A0A3S3S4K7_9ACAR|nr:metal-response element-binding transcription factor 2-like protein [Dinothrombium tinctorium]RWS09035.1 metal-response element-binding transcription factor 2-like protein [Dinothrombium tinctorium]RWS11417.1 metal-response element-binding transcription factor 2-like protein [Dinothrombium tinctorium]
MSEHKKSSDRLPPSNTSTNKTFAYDLHSLHWDDEHCTNEENKYCYCGKEGNYYSQMLQCDVCKQWFHEQCIDCLNAPLLQGDHFYIFKCAICNNGKEIAKRILMKWSDLLLLVLYNLTKSHSKAFFDIRSEIIPFIRSNGERFQVTDDLCAIEEEKLFETVNETLRIFKRKFISKRLKSKQVVWALKRKPSDTSFPIFGRSFSKNDSNEQIPEKSDHNSLNDSQLKSISTLTKSSELSINSVNIELYSEKSSWSNENFQSADKQLELMNDQMKVNEKSSSEIENNSGICNKTESALKVKRRKLRQSKSNVSGSYFEGIASSLNESIPIKDNFETNNDSSCDPVAANYSNQIKQPKASNKRKFYGINNKLKSPLKNKSQRKFSQNEGKDFVIDEKLENDSKLYFEKCKILGRRVTKTGRVEYLLQWEK